MTPTTGACWLVRLVSSSPARCGRRTPTEFEDSLRQLIAAASLHPGRVNAEVLRGGTGARRQDYHVVYRFTDETSLRDWRPPSSVTGSSTVSRPSPSTCDGAS